MSKKANYMYLPVADLEIDLRNDTVQADKMLAGYTAHDKSGEIITGNVAVYDISVSITNGTSSGATLILDGNIAEVELSADNGYALPSSIIVSGATYNYDSSTGKVVLSEPTGSVSITAVCEEAQPSTSYLTFSSTNGAFEISFDNGLYCDGTLEYSLDGNTWTTLEGGEVISVDNEMYLRGNGNTVVSNGNRLLAITGGSDVSIDGNIETLLDWQTVEQGIHPAMANLAFASCFNGVTGLIKGPDLMAEYPAQQAYQQMYVNCTDLQTSSKIGAIQTSYRMCSSMYNGCISLSILSALEAVALEDGCYRRMYMGCPSIVLNDTYTDGDNTYRIPYRENGAIVSGNPLDSMFGNTSGNVTTPNIDTNYYTPNTIIE